MTDFHPQIAKIEKKEKHPNADELSIYYVLGDYPVIDRSIKYKTGDLVAYISIDSVFEDTEQFSFIFPQKFEKYKENGEIKQRPAGLKYSIGSTPESSRRLKAKRIRGIYSQGLLLDCPPGFKEGDSVVDHFNLTKFIEEEEDNIPNAKKSRGTNAESPPKGWAIPHYDIEGLRKYVACLKEDEEIVLTEKLHGSNAAFCHDGERLWVKSRNFYKKMDEDDPWWDIAIRYDLSNKLAQFPMKVFFGELYGNVKGFRYDCELINGAMHSKIKFFDIWDATAMRYLDYDPFVDMIKSAGLEAVPELYRGKWNGKEEMYPYAEGPTTLGGKHIREGIVMKTTKERYEPRLNSRMQLKLIGEGYNLQK